MLTLYVTYAGDSSVHFDRNYWVNQHIPLVREIWEPYGLMSAGAFFPSGEGSELIAICPCVFRDEEGMRAALAAPETKRVMDDIKNFTSIQPDRNVGKPV